MVHVLLLILKWLGITLLILLGIVLLVIILFLLVPFQYKIDAEYYEEFKAVARIQWLIFVLDLKGLYGDSKFLYYLKSFGFTISTNDENDKHYKKPPEDEAETETTSKVVIPKDDFDEYMTKTQGNESPELLETTKSDVPAIEKQEAPIEKKGFFTKVREKLEYAMEWVTTIPEKIHYKISEILTRILDILANITENIRKLAKKRELLEKKIRQILDFINKESTKQAFKDVIKLLKQLLKHVRPRKYHGKVHFGMDDPSTTGQLLGVVGMLMPLYRNNIVVAPDFEQKIFEGEIRAKGHVQVGFLAIWAMKVLLNRNLMETIKRGKMILGGINNGK